MWFESLAGFAEQSPQQVRERLVLNGDTITSTANGRSVVCGRLETPTLAELRHRLHVAAPPIGKLRVREHVGDVQHLHVDPANSNALFQVASQFNLLEMVSPSVTPEMGVGIYEHDKTQGPACAIAAGGGTIYRNYFAEVNGLIGQSSGNQIDCLADVGALLGNKEESLWGMRNGYALPSGQGLKSVQRCLAGMSDETQDELRAALRVGIHWGTQVTLSQCQHCVTQVFGSALPVAYTPHASSLWEPFAQLILEASYEATLIAAVLNMHATGNNCVYLTLLGGGAFRNDPRWISEAIRRAIEFFADFPLDVVFVSHRSSSAFVRRIVGAR